jgi:hypothetical protein
MSLIKKIGNLYYKDCDFEELQKWIKFNNSLIRLKIFDKKCSEKFIIDKKKVSKQAIDFYNNKYTIYWDIIKSININNFDFINFFNNDTSDNFIVIDANNKQVKNVEILDLYHLSNKKNFISEAQHETE